MWEEMWEETRVGGRGRQEAERQGGIRGTWDRRRLLGRIEWDRQSGRRQLMKEIGGLKANRRSMT